MQSNSAATASARLAAASAHDLDYGEQNVLELG